MDALLPYDYMAPIAESYIWLRALGKEPGRGSASAIEATSDKVHLERWIGPAIVMHYWTRISFKLNKFSWIKCKKH